MKSPERNVFEIILITSAALAVALLPLAAEAACGKQHQPPAFAEVDADGDGFVSEEEFNAFRAARHQAMAEEGRPMKGMATAPAFADVDSDGDGKLTEAELTAAQQAHMQAMQAAKGDVEQGKDHGKGMGQGKGQGDGMGKGMHHGAHGCGGEGRKMPTFGDLDLNGDGCIDADEFAKHQAEMHG